MWWVPAGIAARGVARHGRERLGLAGLALFGPLRNALFRELRNGRLGPLRSWMVQWVLSVFGRHGSAGGSVFVSVRHGWLWQAMVRLAV